MSEFFDPFTATYRQTGASARQRAVTSAKMLTSAIKTSYGALGLDKMCISSTGDVTVTNDGVTILSSMILDDPIADLIIELSKQQDNEMGDGTTGIVLLAASLIEKGVELIDKGLHPSIVVSGYKMAYKEAAFFIKNEMNIKNMNLEAIVRTTLASKVLEGDHFIKLVLDAVENTKKIENGKVIYEAHKINILKKEGNSMYDSETVKGYCINAQPSSRLMKKKIENARICLLDFDLAKIRLPINVNVVCENPEDLENNRKSEIRIAVDRVKKILENVDVILTTKNIDDTCTKPIIDADKISIKRVPMKDIETLSKALNLPISRTEDVETAIVKSVEVKQLSNENFTIISTPENVNLCSIILRGPNEQVLEEMHRSVHDGLCSLSRVLETGKILPGGGALEIALSLLFERFARSLTKKESIAILSFAESLHIIPKTLAVNAGLDSNHVLSDIIHKQIKSFENGDKQAHFYGLDVLSGEIGNNIERGIVEPAVLKLRALRAAVEVAIAILRIDEIIKVPPAPVKQRDACGA